MATLTVTLTESVSLNGREQGATNSFTVANVDETYKRIVTCPEDVDTTIATFRTSTSTADNALDLEDVKYIRVTNLDSTNPINLSLQIDAGEDNSAADESTTFLIEAGKSFVMGSPHESILVDDDAATVNVSNVALMDLRSIHVDPVSEAIQVEVFIASA